MADDIASLAIQRLMAADSAARAHEESARRWHRLKLFFAVFIAVSASVAAVSVVKENPVLSLSFTLLIAILVPLEASLKVETRAVEEMVTAGAFRSLANRIERFIQLDLGPRIWRLNSSESPDELGELYVRFEEFDQELDDELVKVPPIALSRKIVNATESRGSHLVAYLKSENVRLPPVQTWANSTRTSVKEVQIGQERRPII